MCTTECRRQGGGMINMWLGVSAVVMTVALLGLWMKPGRALEATAKADPMVSSTGNITLMTTESGIDEVLVVLDGRTESMLVYRVENASSVELLQRASIPQMFTDAKMKAAGN